jgi:hypothetical protein
VLRHFPRLGNLQVLQLAKGDSVADAVTRYQESGLVELPSRTIAFQPPPRF